MDKKVFVTDKQKATLETFSKVDDHIYTVEYKNNYYLDRLLTQGVKSMGELISFVSKEMKLPKRYLKLNDVDFGCTTFNAITPNDDYILARNFDFKDAPCCVIWTAPENGYKSIGVVDTNFLLYGYEHQKIDDIKSHVKVLMTPYCITDGINEKGLSIAVLELKTKSTKQETGRTPVITTVMIRAVLDKCATIEEAVDLFKCYDMHDSLFCCYHYQIVDKTGRSAIIEYVDNSMQVIYDTPVCNEKVNSQFCANFYVSRDGDNAKGFGYDRYDIVKNGVAALNGVVDEKQAMQLLRECNLYYIKKPFGYWVTTLWSAVYNVTKCTMDLCARMDYDNHYRFSIENPQMYEKI